MALLLATCLSVAVFAATPASGEDAPRRVGSLDYISGEVTYVLRSEPGEPNGADTENWLQADFDQPVCQDMSLRTGALARARVSIGPDAIEMSDDTWLNMLNLNDQLIEASIRYGRIHLQLGKLDPGESIELEMPRGSLWLLQPGAYDIEIGDRGQPTRIVVFEGKARFVGGAADMPIDAGKFVEVTGNYPAVATVESDWTGTNPAKAGRRMPLPGHRTELRRPPRYRLCQNRRAAPSRRKHRSLLSMLPPPMTGRPRRPAQQPTAARRHRRAAKRSLLRATRPSAQKDPVPSPPRQDKSLPTIFCSGLSNPTKINSSKRLAKQSNTSRPRPPEPMTSTVMADGAPLPMQDRCGSRLPCLTTGRLIALAIGIGSNRGAGLGSTISPGVSRRFTMAGGSTSTAIGDGPRALSIPIRSMPRRSLPLSMHPPIPVADPMVDPTSAGSRSVRETITRHGIEPGPITSWP